MSRAQAQVVVATLDRLPVKQSLRDEAEELLIDHARTLDASDLHKVGRHLVVVVDPDGDEREAERKLAREERAAHLGRFLTLSDDGVGGVRIKGRTTVEDAAVIKAALFPLAAPTPTGTPGDCGGRPGRGCTAGRRRLRRRLGRRHGIRPEPDGLLRRGRMRPRRPRPAGVRRPLPWTPSWTPAVACSPSRCFPSRTAARPGSP